jgi:hypothetical protein
MKRTELRALLKRYIDQLNAEMDRLDGLDLIFKAPIIHFYDLTLGGVQSEMEEWCPEEETSEEAGPRKDQPDAERGEDPSEDDPSELLLVWPEDISERAGLRWHRNHYALDLLVTPNPEDKGRYERYARFLDSRLSERRRSVQPGSPP